MSDESKQILRSSQCARIIVCISEMFDVPLDKATDIFYVSETASMIEVWREYQEGKKETDED